MIYAVTFAISSIYGLILYYLARRGYKPIIVDHIPWLVLIWLGYTVVGLSYLIPRDAWEQTVGILVAAFLPMMAVHFVSSVLRERRLVEYLRKRGADDRAEALAALCGDCSHRDDCPSSEDHGAGARSK